MNTRKIQIIVYSLFTAALLAHVCWAVYGQQATPAPHPATAQAAKPPTITDAQKAAYWKAVSQRGVVEKQLDAANQAIDASVKAMSEACGKDYTLTGSQSGDPECVAKPQLAKEAK